MEPSHPSTVMPVSPVMPVTREPWLVGTMRGAGHLTQAHVEARRAYVAPLFDYCQGHSIIVIQVVRRAAERVGAEYIWRNRVMRIKNGSAPAPWWFIAEVCREIGQPIEVVMGREWTQRHLPSLPTPSTFPTSAAS